MLVTIDTLRADHVGAYGYELAHTPTLDALAAAGTLFETALSPAPLTLPAHSTLFTGLEPPRHGVRHNSVYRLSPNIPTVTERLADAGYATAAFVGAVVLHPRYGLGRRFDRYDATSERFAAGLGGYAERPADAVADAALDWLEDAPARFFLWLHFYDPHAEYEPPPGFRLAARSPYDGEIAFADAQLGRVLAAVSERFGSEGTLVVATSDHGEALLEHGEITHSYGVYEATQRIPMILSGPGVPSGRRIHAPVRLADLGPTLLALAGAEPLGTEVDGRDLGPWLESGEPPTGNAAAYMETVATRFDYGWSPLFALRGERWKYILAPRPELYDLLEDPNEETNVIDREPERVRALDSELAVLRAQVPVAAAEAVVPSPHERAQLESLGYVVTAASDAVSFEVAGRDPKDGTQTLHAVAEASRLRAAGHVREAYELLRGIEEDGIQLLQIRYHAALQAGLHEAAEDEARNALARDPSRSDSHALLAAALEIQGREQEAYASYSRSLELEADRPYAALGRARTTEALGNTEAAARGYQLTRELDDTLAEPVWRLAALAIERGDGDAAAALLGELETGDTAKPEATLRLALAEEHAGRSDAAIERLALVRQTSPEHENLARYSAYLLERTGDAEGLLAVAEDFLARRPGTAWAQNAVAFSLALLERDLERALDLARLALATLGPNPAILDTLITVHLARREPEAALVRVDEALAADSDSLEARLHFMRSSALEALGRTDEARRELARSLDTASEPGAPWLAERRMLAKRLGVVPASDAR